MNNEQAAAAATTPNRSGTHNGSTGDKPCVSPSLEEGEEWYEVFVPGRVSHVL